MNKRIQELSVQSKNSVPAGLNTEEWINKYNEIFAKLLVKECAYLVNDYQRSTGYTDYAKMLCNKFNIEFNDEDYFGE